MTNVFSKVSSADGIMGNYFQSKDWSKTSLGPETHWSQPLFIMVNIVLMADRPMFVLWGAERIMIYNDSFINVLSLRHPKAFGLPFFDVWPEFKADFNPLINQVYEGKSVHSNDLRTVMHRHGYPEEGFISFSFIPVWEQSGSVGGTFCPFFEIKGSHVLGEQISAPDNKLKDEEYKILFDSIDEGFCVIEVIFDENNKPADYCFLETNQAFEMQTGLHDVVGKRMRELVPDHEAHWFEIYGDIALTGQPVRFIREAKPLMHGSCDVYAFRLGGDTSRKVGVLFSDVTERSQTEEALRHSQEHLKLILESARDYAIFTTDLNRDVTDWNTGAENLLGYKREEMIGQRVDIIFTPEDRQTQPSREVAIATRNGRAENERWHLRKDGNRFWGSGLTMPLRHENGDIRGFLKIMRDHTERRQIEESLQKAKEGAEEAELRLSLALDAAAMGAWDWDIGKDTVICNRRYAEIFAFETETELLPSRILLEYIHPKDKPLMKEKLSLAEQSFDLELRIIRKDNVFRWVKINANVFYDEGGKPRRVIGSVMDITARKLLEQQKDDFMAIVSHELKTPVTSMRGYIQIAEQQLRGKGDVQAAEWLNKVDGQIDRMIVLINDLLDITKIESGKMQFEYETFDFDLLVDDIVNAMRIISKTHELIVEGKTGKAITADKSRTGQVIINFVSNAIKYSPNASRVIIRSSVEGENVKLSVEDFGPGISRANLKRVFDRFYRVNDQKNVAGLGLGLYISAEIIKRQNGAIWAESTEGKGSFFNFTLPVTRPEVSR